ncbi:6-carboxytetrahydropterin synthase [Streptomyces coffeae]|uniref:6-carboxy-5,6,7,8-tetrahydropterin synthase n=1 Tax=Streptomyces coffeae TaxID=621382 RepID=A0ABS1NEG9_9ACTN|nr:6-carboxytetrahydropterin synthase [Streptomyces coffeae]MBL1098347.1 6-carboxytetrahydropterin synthase [Streptomyces coffeae]
MALAVGTPWGFGQGLWSNVLNPKAASVHLTLVPQFLTSSRPIAPQIARLAVAHSHLDHRSLNEVLPVEPTSENLAQHLAEWFVEHIEPEIEGRLEKVRVSETPSSWAEFEVIRP